jgi:hypothetical protein
MSSSAQDDMIRTLEEMGGWPRDSCQAALQLVGNNLEGAAELLLGGFAIPPGMPLPGDGGPLPLGMPLPDEDEEDEEGASAYEEGPHAADLLQVRPRRPPLQLYQGGWPPEHAGLSYA